MDCNITIRLLAQRLVFTFGVLGEDDNLGLGQKTFAVNNIIL